MRAPVLSLAFASLMACNDVPAQQGPAPASTQPTPRTGAVRVETVARGLDHPWAIEFLPDGRMIVTERPGRLRIVSKHGHLSAPLSGVPRVSARGQGGLLDVALDPDFAKNRTIYLSFAEAGDGGTGTAVARARLTESSLEELRVIYRQEPKVSGTDNHYGSRIVFGRDGTLWITQGDRFNQRPLVQDLSTDIGKIVRIRPDGSAPSDNPFGGTVGTRPEIWSLGHRNVQAAAMDPETGELWTVEHGAAGGDELNNPKAGRNYGWPVITYGRDYDGSRIGVGVAQAGMEQPVYYWDPVIAPSGMTFYSGNAFPNWKGDILIGGLATQALVHLTMRNGRVADEERFDMDDRIRDVKQGPDGLIYLVTDNGSGRVLRVSPLPH